MDRAVSAFFIFFAFLVFAASGLAQANEICSSSGDRPALGDSIGLTPYVFGKVNFNGYDPAAKLPRVTITYAERGEPDKRLILDQRGLYCFRRRNPEAAGTVVLFLDGVEVARRSIFSLGPAQQREDFDVNAPSAPGLAPPGKISAKYTYPPNAKTEGLYKKALEAEKNKDPEKLLKYVKEIVAVDPADFIAWAKLGSLHFERKSFPDAEAAFKRSLALKPEYVPAMINLARAHLAQKQSENAIEISLKATALEPTSARAFQLLGQAYLQAKKGTLGVEALNKAIELDPIGMADSHLLMAILYDRAGAKDLATLEYKAFLSKVPNHPDKAKFEQYIKDNPE